MTLSHCTFQSPLQDELKEGALISGTEAQAILAMPLGPQQAPARPGNQGLCAAPPQPSRTYHMVQLLHHALNDLGFALQQLWSKFLVQPGLEEGTP